MTTYEFLLEASWNRKEPKFRDSKTLILTYASK